MCLKEHIITLYFKGILLLFIINALDELSDEFVTINKWFWQDGFNMFIIRQPFHIFFNKYKYFDSFKLETVYYFIDVFYSFMRNVDMISLSTKFQTQNDKFIFIIIIIIKCYFIKFEKSNKNCLICKNK